MKKLIILILALMFLGGCVSVVWTPYMGDEPDQRSGNLIKFEKKETRKNG